MDRRLLLAIGLVALGGVSCRKSNDALCERVITLRERAGASTSDSSARQTTIGKCIVDMEDEEAKHPSTAACHKQCIGDATTWEQLQQCTQRCP